MFPRRLRPLSPLLPPFTTIESTSEDRDLALKQTKAVLLEIRDMVRSLDLPADVIPVALDMYGSQLGVILSRKEELIDQERLRKIYEIEQAMVKQHGHPMMGPGGQYIPVGVAQDAGIYGMTAEQLDREYDRVVKKVGVGG